MHAHSFIQFILDLPCCMGEWSLKALHPSVLAESVLLSVVATATVVLVFQPAWCAYSTVKTRRTAVWYVCGGMHSVSAALEQGVGDNVGLLNRYVVVYGMCTSLLPLYLSLCELCLPCTDCCFLVLLSMMPPPLLPPLFPLLSSSIPSLPLSSVLPFWTCPISQLTEPLLCCGHTFSAVCSHSRPSPPYRCPSWSLPCCPTKPNATWTSADYSLALHIHLRPSLWGLHCWTGVQW